MTYSLFSNALSSCLFFTDFSVLFGYCRNINRTDSKHTYISIEISSFSIFFFGTLKVSPTLLRNLIWFVYYIFENINWSNQSLSLRIVFSKMIWTLVSSLIDPSLWPYISRSRRVSFVFFITWCCIILWY